MSETAFTKGPWQARASGLASVVDARDFGSVAKVYGNNERCIANAHLIAAAPDLYEALRKLVADTDGTLRMAEDGIRAEIGNTNYSLLMQRIADAEAALAKARGDHS